MELKRFAGAAAAAAWLFAAPAAAQPYVGIGFGQSDMDDSIAEGLITSGTVDGKDTGLKLFGGYQLNRNFALEAAYVDLGSASYSGSFFGAPVTGGSVDVSGFNFSAVGTLPLAERFSLFGKVGLFVWQADASDITGGAPFSASEDGSDVSFGLGAAYELTKTLSLRAEWERFKAQDSDIDLLSLGLLFRF